MYIYKPLMKLGTVSPGRAHHVYLWSSLSLTQSQNLSVLSLSLLLGKKSHFPLSFKTKDIHPEPPDCLHSPALHNIASPPFGPVGHASWREKLLFKGTTLASASPRYRLAPGSSPPVFSFSQVSAAPLCLLASLCGSPAQSLSPRFVPVDGTDVQTPIFPHPHA